MSYEGKLLVTSGDPRTEVHAKVGERRNPRVAVADEKSQVLVCDVHNDRMQLMPREGHFSVVDSDKEISRPQEAVVVKDHVCVTSFNKTIYLLSV